MPARKTVTRKTIAEPKLSESEFVLEGIDTSSGPLYGPTETAKVFWGRTAHWIRWLEQREMLVINGKNGCKHTRTERVLLNDDPPTCGHCGSENVTRTTRKIKARTRAKVKTKARPANSLLCKDCEKVTKAKWETLLISLVSDKTGKCTKCGGLRVGQRRTDSGARVYSLNDIEEMAHAMAQNGAITGGQLRNTLLMVQTSARIHEYLSDLF